MLHSLALFIMQNRYLLFLLRNLRYLTQLIISVHRSLPSPVLLLLNCLLNVLSLLLNSLSGY